MPPKLTGRMKITALPPQKHDPDRLSVFVDGAFRMGLSAEVALAANLRVGQTVDEARLLELERRDRGWQAREAALRLLAVRPRSAAELARRLRMKGYEPEVAEEVIARLRDLGMIDDAAFAGTLVRDRVRLRPQGARRLANELRAKGVDDEIARTAIRDTMAGEETDERELARRAAEKWRPRPGEEPARARRRLHGFLARRGFDAEVIREVLDEAAPDGADE
jgi:regulatory protein